MFYHKGHKGFYYEHKECIEVFVSFKMPLCSLCFLSLCSLWLIFFLKKQYVNQCTYTKTYKPRIAVQTIQPCREESGIYHLNSC